MKDVTEKDQINILSLTEPDKILILGLPFIPLGLHPVAIDTPPLFYIIYLTVMYIFLPPIFIYTRLKKYEMELLNEVSNETWSYEYWEYPTQKLDNVIDLDYYRNKKAS